MWRILVNKPNEQNASTEPTSKAPSSFRPEPAVKDKDINPAKDAPGRPAPTGTAKGDDGAVNQPKS